METCGWGGVIIRTGAAQVEEQPGALGKSHDKQPPQVHMLHLLLFSNVQEEAATVERVKQGRY